MSTLKKNLVFLLGMQGINYLVPLIILPYLVRVLGPVEYGSLTFSMTIVQYIVLFTDFGFTLSSSRDIAKHKDNIDYVNKIFSATIYIKLLFGLISTIILLILIYSFDSFYLVRNVIYCGLFYVLGSILTPSWLFQGLERVSIFSTIASMLKLLIIPLVFIFVKTNKDADIAISIQGIVFLLTALLSFFYAYRRFSIRFIKINLSEIFSSVKGSAVIFLGTVSISLYTMSSPIILGLVSSMQEVGYFSAAKTLVYAAVGVLLAMSGALYPRVNSLFYKNKDEGFFFVKKLLLIMFPVLTLGTIVFYFLGTPVAVLFLGKQYIDAALLVKIMSPLIIFIPISVVLSNYLLLPLGEDKLFTKIPIITLILHICYSIVLASYYGALGASIAILITEIISTTILTMVNLKKGYLQKVILSHA